MNAQVTLQDFCDTAVAAEQSESHLSDEEEALCSDKFDCCHRYRECSDARCCIRADDPKCAYKKHLEAGNVFYGKNAKWFSADAYEEVCAKVRLLSDEDKNEFLRFLFYFFHTKYLAETVTCELNESLNRLTACGLLQFVSQSSSLLRERLTSHCRSVSRACNAEWCQLLGFAYRTLPAKHSLRVSASDIKEMLLLSGLYLQDYTIATYDTDLRSYLLEYFLDFIQPLMRNPEWLPYDDFLVPASIEEK